MVVVQKWQFFQIFFQEIKSRKMCFTKFQKEKTPLQTVKKRTLKSRKINIFPKELTYGFGPKFAIFPSFIFQALQDRKMCFTIFQNEKTPFQALKTRSSKSRKIDILRTVLIQKLPFSQPFFFLAIQAKKIAFMIFQNEKTHFQALKTRSSKSRKI